MIEIARQCPPCLKGYIAISQSIELADDGLRGRAYVVARGHADQINGTQKAVEHSSPVVRRALAHQLIGLIQIVMLDGRLKVLLSLRRAGFFERFFLRREISFTISDRVVDDVLNVLAQARHGTLLLLQFDILLLEKLEVILQRLMVLNQG